MKMLAMSLLAEGMDISQLRLADLVEMDVYRLTPRTGAQSTRRVLDGPARMQMARNSTQQLQILSAYGNGPTPPGPARHRSPVSRSPRDGPRARAFR